MPAGASIHKEQTVAPNRLISRIGIVSIAVVCIHGSCSVGSHDMSCYRSKIRGFKSTLIANPAACPIDGQRPPATDQSAKARYLLTGEEGVANQFCSLWGLLGFHIGTKYGSYSSSSQQPFS